MSQFLHNFFDGADQGLSDIIRDLEPLAGHAGIDINFAFEVKLRLTAVYSRLGLDPKDTTARELYYALTAKVLADDKHFADSLGLSSTSREQKVAAAVANLVAGISTRERVFVPKRSIIKNLLNQKPPKSALKLLHYRSFDSMYKRCPMTMIIAAVELTAPKKWREWFQKSLAELKFNDFEERPIEFLTTQPKRWEQLHKRLIKDNGHNILTVKPAGGILIVPGNQVSAAGQTLLFGICSLRGVERLRRLSILAKRTLMVANGHNYSDVLYALNPPGTVQLRSVDIHFRHQHRLMAEQTDILALFEPHVSSEHARSFNPAKLLSKYGANLDFWQDTDWLGVVEDGQVTSCNLLDVLLNAVYKRNYGNHTSRTLKTCLKDELLHRYLVQDLVREVLKNKLSEHFETHESLMLELDQDL